MLWIRAVNTNSPPKLFPHSCPFPHPLLPAPWISGLKQEALMWFHLPHCLYLYALASAKLPTALWNLQISTGEKYWGRRIMPGVKHFIQRGCDHLFHLYSISFARIKHHLPVFSFEKTRGETKEGWVKCWQLTFSSWPWCTFHKKVSRLYKYKNCILFLYAV